MTSKAILFDLDGTLVETAPDLMAAHNHVMEKYGYEKKPWEILDIWLAEVLLLCFYVL